MTEDEAKTKWCPFAQSRIVAVEIPNGAAITRTFGGENVVFNGVSSRLPVLTCVGSGCMAWVDEGASAEWERTGRCGLAGKP